MHMSIKEFEQRRREFSEWADKIVADLSNHDGRSEFQRKLDASVTEEDAREYVRKERERNANRDKPIPAPRDGFINDYD
jgi:hypothetical protein